MNDPIYAGIPTEKDYTVHGQDGAEVTVRVSISHSEIARLVNHALKNKTKQARDGGVSVRVLAKQAQEARIPGPLGADPKTCNLQVGTTPRHETYCCRPKGHDGECCAW